MCLRRWVRAGGYETINGAVHNYSGAMPIWHGGREFLGLSFFFFFLLLSFSIWFFSSFLFFSFFSRRRRYFRKRKKKKIRECVFH